jgi:hypothetical protein
MINIPFKSKLQSIDNIHAKNKAFAELTNEGKRREIAYDSLMLIINNMLFGNPSGYWNKALLTIRHNSKNSKDFCRKLNNLPQQKCSVCARGAVMVSQIRLGNNISPTNGYSNAGHISIMDGFSMNDMDKMEGVYEGWRAAKHAYPPNTTQLLANMMCNIIANGNFKSKDRTDYLKVWELEVVNTSYIQML